MDCKAFLGKLFVGVPLDRVWVGWNEGVGKGFPGGPADEYLDRLPAGAGHYFCIGSLKPGRVTRKLADIEKIHALVLDDIGTKALDTPGIVVALGQPTWIMETSKGNFQWGWRYSEPVEAGDWALHAAVVMECVARWGVDKAGADPNRLVRLPSGVNLKEGRGLWPTTLGATAWERSVALEDLVLLLDIHPEVVGLPVAGGGVDLAELAGASLADAGWDIWVAALLELGLAKYDKPNGIEIECPWVGSHTDTKDGTAYLGRNEKDHSGRWKCQHDHCADKKSRDFEREIEQQLGLAGENLASLLAGMAPAEERQLEDEYVARKALEHVFDPDPDAPPPGARAEAGALAYKSEAEAVARLIYAHAPERFVDEPTGKVMTAKQVDEALWKVDQGGKIKRGQKALSNELLVRSGLRKVDHFTYRPGRGKIVADELEGNLSAVNTWTGSKLVRAPAGKHLKVILAHIGRLFPDAAMATAMTNWMGALVQHPEVKITWMPIVIGVGGTGKDVLFGMLRPLLGVGNMTKLGTERLLDEDSRFRAFTGCQVVILEELSMTLVKGKDVATILKPLITEDRVYGRGVYESATTKPNTASVLAYSNTENALNISPDADDQRRYLPYLSPAKGLTAAEADELVDAAENGAGELLGFLLDRDLVANGWNPYRKPDIASSKAAAQTMASAGASGPVKEVVDLLDGSAFCDRTLILSSEITDALRNRRVGTSALHAIGDGMVAGGFTRWKDQASRFGTEGRSRVWVKKGTDHGAVDVSVWTDDQMRAAVAAERAAATAIVFDDAKVVSMKKPGKEGLNGVTPPPP